MWTNARDPLGRIHTTQWKLQHEKRSMLHYKIYTSTPKIPRDIPSASCTVSQKPVEQTRLSIIVGGVTTTKPNRSNPKNTINMSPSNKARRLLELQVQHVQELQHDVLEAHPKQAARRFPVYHAVRFIDIQSGSNIIKLLMLMWTSWNMLEPLHEPSWYLKTTHHVSACGYWFSEPVIYTTKRSLQEYHYKMWLATWTIIQSCLTPYPAAWSPQHPQAVQRHLPELAVTTGMGWHMYGFLRYKLVQVDKCAHT